MRIYDFTTIKFSVGFVRTVGDVELLHLRRSVKHISVVRAVLASFRTKLFNGMQFAGASIAIFYGRTPYISRTHPRERNAERLNDRCLPKSSPEAPQSNSVGSEVGLCLF